MLSSEFISFLVVLLVVVAFFMIMETLDLFYY